MRDWKSFLKPDESAVLAVHYQRRVDGDQMVRAASEEIRKIRQRCVMRGRRE